MSRRLVLVAALVVWVGLVTAVATRLSGSDTAAASGELAALLAWIAGGLLVLTATALSLARRVRGEARAAR